MFRFLRQGGGAVTDTDDVGPDGASTQLNRILMITRSAEVKSPNFYIPRLNLVPLLGNLMPLLVNDYELHSVESHA